jgi:hypothetical protein
MARIGHRCALMGLAIGASLVRTIGFARIYTRH